MQSCGSGGDESFEKAMGFANKSKYGVVLKVEIPDVPYIQKAQFTFGNEKEWHIFGPVKAQIFTFNPKMDANQMFYWFDYFNKKK
jgi:hypothetical protein